MKERENRKKTENENQQQNKTTNMTRVKVLYTKPWSLTPLNSCLLDPLTASRLPRWHNRTHEWIWTPSWLNIIPSLRAGLPSHKILSALGSHLVSLPRKNGAIAACWAEYIAANISVTCEQSFITQHTLGFAPILADVGPSSTMLAQHQPNIEPTPRVCWECSCGGSFYT